MNHAEVLDLRNDDKEPKKYVTYMILTATDASLAATASMSAQETTPGHVFSTRRFAASMTSKPLTELFVGEVFSL